MKENQLVELSMDFAVAVVNTADSITVPKSAYIINQFGRAGTSIGANIHEAQYAHSRADFIAKFEIALKEANETTYWLKLMYKTNRISEETYKCLSEKCGKIRMLLIASCTTAKKNK